MNRRPDRRRPYRGLVIAFGATAGAAAVALAPLAFSQSKEGARARVDDPYYQLSRFGAALDLIRNHYVDPPDEAKLIEAALKAMAASLDPHSGYVSGEAYRLLQSRIKGEFAGVREIDSHVEGGDIGYIQIPSSLK